MPGDKFPKLSTMAQLTIRVFFIVTCIYIVIVIVTSIQEAGYFVTSYNEVSCCMEITKRVPICIHK